MTYNKITVGENGKLTVEQIAKLNDGKLKHIQTSQHLTLLQLIPFQSLQQEADLDLKNTGQLFTKIAKTTSFNTQRKKPLTLQTT